jgi:7,8-dihydropterin-6-yl-methyl-4-(beta-D-ribofuranosyl)aminobenzene 5'-phosphate synthase
MLKIYILAENRTQRKEILAEHGLSILVEYDCFKVLFDTGQKEVFAANAKTAGIDLAAVDALVISHGHYDHAGGVPEFCRLNSKAPIYLHPEVFGEKYIAHHGKPAGASIGIPWDIVEIDSWIKRAVYVREPFRIHEKIMLSGQVLRNSSKKKIATGLIKKNAAGIFEKDAVLDEQFLLIEGRKGIYLVIACSHQGIFNCLAHARQIFPAKKIYGIIGGLHLERYNKQQMQLLVAEFQAAGVEKIIPLHCTKIQACHLLHSLFGDNCLLLNTGEELVLENRETKEE